MLSTVLRSCAVRVCVGIRVLHCCLVRVGHRPRPSPIAADSGTTDTYLPAAVAAGFRAAWARATGGAHGGYTPGGVYRLTAAQFGALPSVFYVLAAAGSQGGVAQGGAEGALATVPTVRVQQRPSAYMEAVEVEVEAAGAAAGSSSASRLYRARVYLDEGAGAVLGANAMQGYDVVFDQAAGRMGWAASACDLTRLTRRVINGTGTGITGSLLGSLGDGPLGPPAGAEGAEGAEGAGAAGAGAPPVGPDGAGGRVGQVAVVRTSEGRPAQPGPAVWQHCACLAVAGLLLLRDRRPA
jgi:hypothetical protein